MEKRIPGSMRTRETLSELIEGRLSAPDARSELMRLATRLIASRPLSHSGRSPWRWVTRISTTMTGYAMTRP